MVEMARLADIPKLVEMRMQEQENDWKGTSYSITEELREATAKCFFERMGKDMFTFVARKGNRIVATATLLAHNYLPQADEITGKRAYLCNVWTIPEERHNGYQKELFEYVKSFAFREEIKRIDLHATESPEVYHMYEGFGFTFRKNSARYFVK